MYKLQKSRTRVCSPHAQGSVQNTKKKQKANRWKSDKESAKNKETRSKPSDGAYKYKDIKIKSILNQLKWGNPVQPIVPSISSRHWVHGGLRR